MKFKMNTIFICIIFLLLGILLASFIFPNKCVESFNDGDACMPILNEYDSMAGVFHASMRQSCAQSVIAQALGKSLCQNSVNDLLTIKRKLTSGLESDADKDLLNEAIDKINKCNSDTNYGEGVLNICKDDITNKTKDDGSSVNVVSDQCVRNLYRFWNDNVKSNQQDEGKFCGLVERINGLNGGGTMFPTDEIDSDSDDVAKFLNFITPDTGKCNLTLPETDQVTLLAENEKPPGSPGRTLTVNDDG